MRISERLYARMMQELGDCGRRGIMPEYSDWVLQRLLEVYGK